MIICMNCDIDNLINKSTDIYIILISSGPSFCYSDTQSLFATNLAKSEDL